MPIRTSVLCTTHFALHPFAVFLHPTKNHDGWWGCCEWSWICQWLPSTHSVLSFMFINKANQTYFQIFMTDEFQTFAGHNDTSGLTLQFWRTALLCRHTLKRSKSFFGLSWRVIQPFGAKYLPDRRTVIRIRRPSNDGVKILHVEQRAGHPALNKSWKVRLLTLEWMIVIEIQMLSILTLFT